MMNPLSVKAVTLDLDDTLWPVWPTIERAEKALADWLGIRAPATAALLADTAARHGIREQVARELPALRHDLSAMRRELIRLALYRSGDDPLLAEPAFDVFYAARNRVTLFGDAVPALEFLSRRFPLVALSNGNADIGLVGIGGYFKAAVSARQVGVGKPDARIFQAAIAAAGVKGLQAREVLHVGDDAALDVLPALDCGMQAVWLNREDKLWPHEAAPPATVTTLAELCGLFS